jgi:hypothetical protein
MNYEVICIFLVYYAAGLLAAVLCFRNDPLWQVSVSEHGGNVVAFILGCNLWWPVMGLVTLFFSSRPNRGQVTGVYYGEL